MATQTFGTTSITVDPSWTNVVVRMSGGADSSLVAYMVAKTIIDNDLSARITRMTHNLENFPNTNSINTQTAAAAQAQITSLLGVDVFTSASHEKTYGSDALKADDLLVWLNSITTDCFFDGTTINPPVSMENVVIGAALTERDTAFVNYPDYKYPFGSIAKDAVVQLYHDLGIVSLYQSTTSCISPYDVVPCNECWWCKEREWADAEVT